jgi:hypothetical protein
VWAGIRQPFTEAAIQKFVINTQRMKVTFNEHRNLDGLMGSSFMVVNSPETIQSAELRQSLS